MLRIQNLQIPAKHTEADLKKAAASALKINAAQIQQIKIVKRSIDARKKHDVHYIYTIDVSVDKNEAAVLKKADPKKVSVAA